MVEVAFVRSLCFMLGDFPNTKRKRNGNRAYSLAIHITFGEVKYVAYFVLLCVMKYMGVFDSIPPLPNICLLFCLVKDEHQSHIITHPIFFPSEKNVVPATVLL